jgi:hypothetical protein
MSKNQGASDRFCTYALYSGFILQLIFFIFGEILGAWYFLILFIYVLGLFGLTQYQDNTKLREHSGCKRQNGTEVTRKGNSEKYIWVVEDYFPLPRGSKDVQDRVEKAEHIAKKEDTLSNLNFNNSNSNTNTHNESAN